MSDDHASISIASIPPDTSEAPLANDNIQAESTVPITKDDAAGIGFTDMWSAAYREAVFSFGDDVKSVILKGERIETLLKSLEETNEELAGDSLFRRGVRRLQGPLKNFKLALDMASPLASIEPTASTAVGVVSCVTAVSSPSAHVGSSQNLKLTIRGRLLLLSAEPKAR